MRVLLSSGLVELPGVVVHKELPCSHDGVFAGISVDQFLKVFADPGFVAL